MDSFDGLRFPHWDIPSQARDLMAKVPLRLLADIEDPAIRILADQQSAPPLDISYAQMRGVSPLHVQYLRNMGIRATMT